MWLWMRHGFTTMALKPKFKVCSGNIGVRDPKKFKVLPSAGKVLLSVFWDAQGVIMVDYLQRGATITGLYYADLIHKFRGDIKEKRRGKLRRKVPCSSRQRPKSQVLSCSSCDFNSRLWIARPSTVFTRSSPQRLQAIPKNRGAPAWEEIFIR